MMKIFRFTMVLTACLIAVTMMVALFQPIETHPGLLKARPTFASAPDSASKDDNSQKEIYTSEFKKHLREGKSLYQSRCGSCHNLDGSGIPGVYPPHTDVIDKFVKLELGRRYLVQVMANGLTGQITVAGQTYFGAMPNQNELTNEQIAKISNFMFFSMAEDTPPTGVDPLTSETVADYRNDMATPSQVREMRQKIVQKLQTLEENDKEGDDSENSGVAEQEQSEQATSAEESSSQPQKAVRKQKKHGQRHGQKMNQQHRDHHQRHHAQMGMGHSSRKESSRKGQVCDRFIKMRTPRSNYMHQCSGCHMQNGKGANPSVPPLRESSIFARSTEGREFLIRQPFVASAPLSNAQLADVLTWSLCRYGSGNLPDDFKPFTADEIDRYRDQPLQEVKHRRIELLKKLTQS